MENFAKPSVLKNHKHSFVSTADSIKGQVDELVKKYLSPADNLGIYSEKQKSIVQSLESKFKKYNLNYNQPLISNDFDTIHKYCDSLVDELTISLASLNEDEKSKVLEDSLQISSELTQLEKIYSYIDNDTKSLISYEDEISKFRNVEKDSDHEKVINFKDINKKDEKKDDKNENDFFVNIDEVINNDSIDSSIFDDESENLSNYIDELLKDDSEKSEEVSLFNKTTEQDIYENDETQDVRKLG
jgi:hypothetical protein